MSLLWLSAAQEKHLSMPHWYHSAKNPAKLRPQTPISPPDLSATRSTAPPQQEEFKNQTLKITKQIKQPQIHTLLKDVIGGVELSEAATGKAATRVLVAKFLRWFVGRIDGVNKQLRRPGLGRQVKKEKEMGDLLEETAIYKATSETDPTCSIFLLSRKNQAVGVLRLIISVLRTHEGWEIEIWESAIAFFP
jgi:hypothetical protein